MNADQQTAQALQAEAEAVLFHEAHPMHFGEAVVITLYRIIRGASFYTRNNSVYLRMVQEAYRAICATFRTAASPYLTLHIIHDACLCNTQRVRVSADTLVSYKAFVQLMRARWIGKLEFAPEITVEELCEFAFLFSNLEEHNEQNARLLAEELARHGISTIHALELDASEGELRLRDSEAIKRQSKQVYFTTIGVVKELMTGERTRAEMDLRKAKRLMMSTVNLMLRDESSLLGLANIKSFDDYTFCHSVNVALYAVALGQRVGLPKVQLYYLGISGLFHDIGKLSIPLEILNKPGKLTDEEWTVMRSHPVRGAEVSLRHRAWGDFSSHIMSAAFEHHIKYDGSGYPPLTQPRKATLFSRIITIADCYDALIRPRVYRKMPYVSEKILGLMLAQSGKDFDPLLVKVFINTVGVYPIGALVLLDNNQIGIVTKINENPELVDRPQVCLLCKEDGEYVKGEVIDLAETHPATDAFICAIAETLNPNDYRISIEEFFL